MGSDVVSLPNCAHCQHPPERREKDGALLLICPVCNNRGEASKCHDWAVASWSQVNRDDLPHCCEGKPVRFKQRDQQWWAGCTGCDNKTGGFMSLQGAVAGWARFLR